MLAGLESLHRLHCSLVVELAPLLHQLSLLFAALLLSSLDALLFPLLAAVLLLVALAEGS